MSSFKRKLKRALLHRIHEDDRNFTKEGKEWINTQRQALYIQRQLAAEGKRKADTSVEQRKGR